MARLSARRIALAALRAWRKEKRFADSIISGFLAKVELAHSDRAFAFALFYGVLRNLTLLDFWIGCLRISRIDIALRDILRLGLYQLFLLKTAPHAAVHETVALALPSQRTVVNGMLRAAIRRHDELLARAEAQPLFVRASHPQFLVERWQQHFGTEHAEELCKRNNLLAPIYGRINQLRIGREEFFRLYPKSWPLTRNPEFVEFDALPPAGAIKQGHCYIQDPSTVVAGQILDPKPGEKVLDACAAPGGKTGYIAQLMKNRGTIVACDRDPERLQILKENMAGLAVEIVHAFRHDWTRQVPPEIASMAPFHHILIDAPCSNTGVMRRRVDVRWRLQPADFHRMQQRQLEMLGVLIPLLKPKGTLVYSTCSLEPEENEQVVRRILAGSPALRLIEEKRSLPFQDGFDGAFAAKFVRNA